MQCKIENPKSLIGRSVFNFISVATRCSAQRLPEEGRCRITTGMPTDGCEKQSRAFFRNVVSYTYEFDVLKVVIVRLPRRPLAYN